MAISKTDLFDFLIDIVPRDEIKPQVGTHGCFFPLRPRISLSATLQRRAQSNNLSITFTSSTLDRSTQRNRNRNASYLFCTYLTTVF
jgi:hypothetical protein